MRWTFGSSNESIDMSKMLSSCSGGLGFEFRSYSDSFSESLAVVFADLFGAGLCSDSVSDMLSSGRLNIWEDRGVGESLSVSERNSFSSKLSSDAWLEVGDTGS